MSQLAQAVNVADGVNARHIRLVVLVHLYATGCEADARFLQV